MKSTYKSKIKSLVIAAILIIAGTVIVSANSGNKPKILELNSTSQIEVEYSVEDWMVNLTEWAPEQKMNTYEEVVESNIDIESWMLEANESNWNIEQDTEEEVVVEDWMLNLAKW